MTNAVLDLRQTMPSISSFKPHLNTHECHLSMILNNRTSLPLKMYPQLYSASSSGTIHTKGLSSS